MDLHPAPKSTSHSYERFGSIKEISSQFAEKRPGKIPIHVLNITLNWNRNIYRLKIGTPRFLEVLKVKIGTVPIKSRRLAGICFPCPIVYPVFYWTTIQCIPCVEKYTDQQIAFLSLKSRLIFRRFFNLVLLPRVRDDIAEYKRLNYHLYMVCLPFGNFTVSITSRHFCWFVCNVTGV